MYSGIKGMNRNIGNIRRYDLWNVDKDERHIRDVWNVTGVYVMWCSRITLLIRNIKYQQSEQNISGI